MASKRHSSIVRKEVLHLSSASFLQEDRTQTQPGTDLVTADTKTVGLIDLAELMKTSKGRFKDKSLKQILDDFVENGNIISSEDMIYSVSLITYASDPEVPGPRLSTQMPLFYYVNFGKKDKIFAQVALSLYVKP
jgi:hypothetical protein